MDRASACGAGGRRFESSRARQFFSESVTPLGYPLSVNRPNVDQLGSVASLACAVHCALTGLALGVLSSAGLGFVGSHSLELFFIGSTIALGIWAFITGFRTHRQWQPALFFGCGLAMIYLAHATEPGWIFSVFGGAFLIIFHWVNQKMMRQFRA